MNRPDARPRSGTLRPEPDDDAGFVLISVLGATMLLILLTAALYTRAVARADAAQYEKREDVVLAAADAALDRYTAKVGLNPLYYLYRVDENERARTCTLVGHPDHLVEFAPGSLWPDDCTEWDYRTTPTDVDWFQHPLISTDDTESLIEIVAPEEGQPIEIISVARVPGRGNSRALSARLKSTSLSEFVIVTGQDLYFGNGAAVSGKLYSGGDLGFQDDTLINDEVYAEGGIYIDSYFECPIWVGDAAGYDTEQVNCDAGDVRTKFPEPLSFAGFWEDIDRFETIACGGSGLCFTSGYEAYLVHPTTGPSGDQLTVWGSSTTPPAHDTCTSSTEMNWWFLPDDPSVTWTWLGTFDVPGLGAIYFDGHVVVGNRGSNPPSPSGTESLFGTPITILAGDQVAPKNIIINTDTGYVDPDSTTVVGMIASDEVIINPYAIGSDVAINVQGALLAQSIRWKIPNWCGTSGSQVRFLADGTPVSDYSGTKAELNFFGAVASPLLGWLSGSFAPRSYNFDPRLRSIAPPFYPNLGDGVSLTDWSEDPLPDWVD